MKSVEQLLELSKNPYYTMSNEERERLDDFLSKNSEEQKSQSKSTKTSDSSTPATVHNKNKVKKETGEVEKINDSAVKTELEDEQTAKAASENLEVTPQVVNGRAEDPEVKAVEELAHPDAVK